MSQGQPAPAGVGAMKLRFLGVTVALLLAATAVCVVATTLAGMYPLRLDVTATRQHALSERTKRMVGALAAPHEIIIVADTGEVAPLVWQRVRDVLDEFDRASPLLRVTIINTAAATDRDGVRELYDRLERLYADDLRRHAGAVDRALATTRTLADESERLSEAVLGARDALDPSLAQVEQLGNQAAVVRLRGQELRRAADIAGHAMDTRIGGSNIPAVDDARAALAPALEAFAAEQDALVRALDEFAGALRAQQLAGADASAQAAGVARRMRDAAATEHDALNRLAPLRLLSIVRTIESQSAVVVASPDAATAVRFASLFPTQAKIDEHGGTTADMRFVGEELLATALASLGARVRPALVIIHPLPTRLMDESGTPMLSAAGFQIVGLVERLLMRGVDVLEWPVGLSESPPDRVTEVALSGRPVVWAPVGVVAVTADAAARNAALFRVVESLVDNGDNILVSVTPSTLPGVGEPDPLVEPLKEFGMRIDTGRPLLQRASEIGGPVVRPSIEVRTGAGDHPIGRAVSGLNTSLAWATPIEIIEAQGAAAPLLTLPDSADTWGEAQWLEFWSMPQQRRDRLGNPPTPDPRRDLVDGPWVVAAAGERPSPTGEGVQRAVAVAASGWFFDAFTQRGRIVDGRTVQAAPGNMELLEAAVYWLAEQDDLIAPSARTGDAPRIAPLTEGQLTALRWALIAGLPLLTLAVGVATRMARG